MPKTSGSGTRQDPWQLTTPSGTSEYTMYRDETLDDGIRKGYRGRFGMYMPPLLEALGLAEVEHNPKNNRMRAT
ncbi:MAG TPA: hypothetical protein VIO86_03420 [Candidatus Dormibacteraeota bacterium]|jgi:hypothetical protein